VSILKRYERSKVVARPKPPLTDQFGLRSWSQLRADLRTVVLGTLNRSRFQIGLSTLGLVRPEISLTAYMGLMPTDGLAPIFNLFDRTAGGTGYSQRVTCKGMRDFRGGRLTYDQHMGVDFVCPPGTPLVAAAPGEVVMLRDRWLRGGLTVSVDHGLGVVSQYTHCSKGLVQLGQRVARGEPVALSGVAGIDMAGSAPWVPPHIHFSVFQNGRPVDPYLAPGEEPGPGTWRDVNDPRPAASGGSDEPGNPVSPVDEKALERTIDTCRHQEIRDELATNAHLRPHHLAALLEDAYFFDTYAWPAEPRTASVRLRDNEGCSQESARLTLPLPAEAYRGARFADSKTSRP